MGVSAPFSSRNAHMGASAHVPPHAQPPNLPPLLARGGRLGVQLVVIKVGV